VSYYSEKMMYKPTYAYTWQLPVKKSTTCDICAVTKRSEIENLKSENSKLKKLVNFLEEEVKSLQFKTALTEKAVPFKKIVKEFTSTPEGKAAWQKAWDERADEWKKLAAAGKISRIKYYRLINGMDQATLAKKLKTAQPNVCRFERPGYNVPIMTLEKLTKIFKVKKGDLIGD